MMSSKKEVAEKQNDPEGVVMVDSYGKKYIKIVRKEVETKVAKPEENKSFNDMNKKELVALAVKKGLEVDGLKKDNIIELLQG